MENGKQKFNGLPEKEPFYDNEADERPCGIGSFRPACLQRLANIQVFVGIYSVISLLSQTLQSYVGSQIPSLEKQFGLKSYHSGLVLAFNDVGFLVCCLLATPLARFVHIPRVLFGCFLLYGICGILCCLPHFISVANGSLQSVTISGSSSSVMKSSQKVMDNMPLCYLNGSMSGEDKCAQDSEDSLFVSVSTSMRNTFLALFGIGMILQGVGKAPRGAFITVYIDDGGKKKKTGFYMGIVIGLSIGGPVLAYTVGGLFSRMYVTLEDVDITPRDPRWIGAWWVGFLVFGIASIVFAIPLLFFPRELKKKPVIQKDAISKMTTKEKIKERTMSFWRILTNPIYLCSLISKTLKMASIAGYIPFLSKYFKTQYNIPLWQANITLALSNISSVCIGAIVGGILSRKFGSNPRKTVGFMVCLEIPYILLFTSGFFLGCDQVDVIRASSSSSVSPLPCSVECGCDADESFPICGSNGITYQSPCYAGCLDTTANGKKFENCTCIPDGQARSGICNAECNNLYPFAVMCFVTGLIGSLQISSSFILQMRSVEDRDKSTAIGLQTFCASLLAWMPMPIVFGRIVDTTCLIWQKTCKEEGSCLVYDIYDFRVKLHVFALSFKVVSFIFLAYVMWKCRRQTEWPQIKKLQSEENAKEMIVLTPKEKEATMDKK